MDWPKKKYSIVYADPPWSYNDKALAGNRGAICKYPVMEFGKLASLQVGRISERDSVLFMWATMPKLQEALWLIEKWGFTYKTNAFTWVKKYPSGGNFLGMGRWTRANAELCLLGTRGKLNRVNAGVISIVETPIGKHSEKPNEVRKRIVDLCGDLPRIELFARQQFEGWDVWGNEADGPLPKGQYDEAQRKLF